MCVSVCVRAPAAFEHSKHHAEEVVRQLKTRFEKDVDTADKSTKLFPQVLHHHTFQF